MAAGGDINGFIVLVTFILTLTIFGTIGRLLVLRHRRRTLAVNISDAAFALFTVLMVISAGIAYDGINSELIVRRKYGANEINTKLFTAPYLKEFFAISLFCTTQVWLLKCAFLGYYWSLCDILTKNTRALLYAVSAYCAITYVGVIAFQLSYCKTIASNWSTGPDRCFPTLTVPGMIFQHWTNITSDIMVLVVSVFTISSLNLGRRDMWALTVVFFIGAMSIAASIVRFTQVYHVVMQADSSVEAIRRTLVWAVIEKLFAFTAFCLPCLRVFYRKQNESSLPDKRAFSPFSSGSSSRHG